MAIHKISLDSTFDFKRLGNAVSTTHAFDGKNYTVNWKGVEESFPAKPGDQFLVNCFGEFPEVIKMKIPNNPVIRELWERRFYSRNRVKSIDQLLEDFILNRKYKRILFISECRKFAVLRCYITHYSNEIDDIFSTQWFLSKDHEFTTEEIKTLTNLIDKIEYRNHINNVSFSWNVYTLTRQGEYYLPWQKHKENLESSGETLPMIIKLLNLKDKAYEWKQNSYRRNSYSSNYLSIELLDVILRAVLHRYTSAGLEDYHVWVIPEVEVMKKSIFSEGDTLEVFADKEKRIKVKNIEVDTLDIFEMTKDVRAIAEEKYAVKVRKRIENLKSLGITQDSINFCLLDFKSKSGMQIKILMNFDEYDKDKTVYYSLFVNGKRYGRYHNFEKLGLDCYELLNE